MKKKWLMILLYPFLLYSCNEEDSLTLEKSGIYECESEETRASMGSNSVLCNVLYNSGDITDNNGQIVVTLMPKLANFEMYSSAQRIKIECEDLKYKGTSYIIDDLYGGFSLSPSSSIQRRIPMTRPGTYKVRATIYFSKGISSVVSNSVVVYMGCPDANRIQSVLEDRFKNLWNTTLLTRREYGGYIYLVNGKDIQMGEIFESEPYTGQEVIGTNIQGTETDKRTNPSYTGTRYIIGIFHTHPPLTYLPPSYMRIPGPSGIDLKEKLDYPGFVYDYSQTIRGGHDLYLPARIYQYGVTMRDF